MKKDQIDTDGNILFLELNKHDSNIKRVFNSDNISESTNTLSLNDEAHVIIKKTQIENIDILTTESGDSHSPAVLHPQEILQYLENLKSQYSLIILDAPPLIPFSDALYLGSAADIFLLIIEAERTRWEVAQEALQRISAAKVKNITTVLNKKRDHIPSIIYRNL
jgi:Mrp family chromosome partitioning ATPase